MTQGKFTTSPTPSNIVSAVNAMVDDIAGKAASSHNHSAGSITSGTLAIANGGTGATTANDACANIGALPTSGGTMTGTIKFNTSEKYQINMTTDDKYIHIGGGTNVDDGAVLALYGQNLSSEYNGTAGGFTLQTKKIDNDANGLGYYALEGTPAGNLMWKQRVVETINNKTTNVIRYENGLQIIFASCSYTNDSTPITLPLPFVNGNYSVIPIAVNANGYGIIVEKNTTSFRITTRQATSPTTALPSGSTFSYIAIGYWK